MRIAPSLMFALLLSACSSEPGRQTPALSREEAAARQRFTEQAYQSAQQLYVESERHQLSSPQGEIYTELQVPRENGKFPLVVYMPGLGEDITAGKLWRDAWARHGFAVLALQPQGVAAGLLSSEDAREGRFFEIARKAFSTESRERRTAMLRFALADIAQRAGEANSLYARIDSTRIVLAGFDLGADTAMAFSGATQPAAASLPQLRGIIAISPFHASGDADETPYASVKLPVLSITSDIDADNFGLVRDVTLRGVPYRGMPEGDKFLLVMKSMIHTALGGALQDAQALRGRDDSDDDAGSRSRGGGRSRSGGGMGRGGPGGEMGGGIGGNMGGGPGDGGMPERRDGAQPGAPGRDNQAQQQQVIESVTLAYLDSVISGSAAAHDWLSLDAPRWLRPYATLSEK